MENSSINLEIRDFIATITINRPSKLNALNKEAVYRFRDILNDLEKNDAVRAIIITGAGDKSFCVGTDVEWLNEWTIQEELSYNGQNLVSQIENMPQPVIAAVNGYALGGGCEMILGCDIRICSEKAKMGLPEVDLGVIPAYGGTQRLARYVGVGKAKELLFTGDMIDASEAKNIGLVNKVVVHEELMDEALKMAAKIASKGPLAVRFVKMSVNMSSSIDLSSGMIWEKMVQGVLLGTEDKTEGIAAFIEKRKPIFKGK